MAKTARQTAFELLIKSDKNGTYSNIALDTELSKSGLDRRDKGFVTALFYGVLERKITLDAVIDRYAKLPPERISAEIHTILRMGVFQLLYLDSVTDAAAVNESVLLAEYCRKPSAKGFVNAILRSFIRDDKKVALPDKAICFTDYLSILYSCPSWLTKKWVQEYGAEQAEMILQHSLGRPPITLRVNTLRITAEDLAKRLTAEGAVVSVHPFMEDCLSLDKGGDIEQLPSYQEGLFWVQDIASQLCCAALDPQPGERVLDLCAAPGGKSFTSAARMCNQGCLEAFDLSAKRAGLIEQGAKRLGFTNIRVKAADARKYLPELVGADRVLCDVPCSGLGVIRRKPEIKYKSPEELSRLPEIQVEILRNGARYVKPGGILLYSTCALSKEENEENVERFLADALAFEPYHFPRRYRDILGKGHMATLFPNKTGSDGFFLAVLRRKA